MKANRINKRKRKKKSCGLCKPHKRGLQSRWVDKPAMLRAEQASKEAISVSTELAE